MKDNKIMLAIPATNLRTLVEKANKEGVQREDIVGIYKEPNQYIMVYYK